MMLILRHVVYYAIFLLWILLFCVFAILPLLWHQRTLIRAAWWWVRGNMFLSHHLLGISYSIKGWDHIPREGFFIVASKHQSAWETYAFVLLFKHPVFILKRTLFYFPIIGWGMKRVGMIGVSRRSTNPWPHLLAQAEATRKQQRPLIIFPEGTRTAPGISPPYKSGVFQLYQKLNAPVIPIALNSGYCWGKKSFLKKPGHITIDIAPPIQPGIKDRQDFMVQLRDTIEERCKKL